MRACGGGGARTAAALDVLHERAHLVETAEVARAVVAAERAQRLRAQVGDHNPVRGGHRRRVCCGSRRGCMRGAGRWEGPGRSPHVTCAHGGDQRATGAHAGPRAPSSSSVGMGLARTPVVLLAGALSKAALRLGFAASVRVEGLPHLLDALADAQREHGRGVVTVCNHISTCGMSCTRRQRR
jgi:hypothetical protein